MTGLDRRGDLELGDVLQLPPVGRGWTPRRLAVAVEDALRGRIPGFGGVTAFTLPEDWVPDLAAEADPQLVLAEWWPAPAGGRDQLVWRLAAPAAPGGPHGEVRSVQRADAAPIGKVGVRPEAMADEITGPLPVGERHVMSFRVAPEDTTGHVQGRPAVLSTPALLRSLEQAAQRLTLPHLSPAHTTVGVRLEVSHLRPAYLDELVTVTATLVGRSRRRLSYLVEAAVGDRRLGVGRHQGHVVPHVAPAPSPPPGAGPPERDS